jgi:Xaa-Pro aminopeptidase
MAPPFSKQEYAARLTRTRSAMRERELEALVVGDPSNINWLTGYDAWSFYTPQVMVLSHDQGPVWIGREMDANTAKYTTYLSPDQVVAYPEALVQRNDVHPGDFMGSWLGEYGFRKARIGFESDTYYLSPRCLDCMRAKVPNADWIDADRLVNWARLVKSAAELEMMRQAAAIAGQVMQVAYDSLRAGVRQCDLMAEVSRAQIRGTADFGGDMPAIHPLVLAGENASAAHPMRTDTPFEHDQTVAFELGACRKRYNVGLARTAHIGKPPSRLTEIAKAVEEGMEAVLESLKAGVACASVHSAWQRVLDRYRLEKKSRIGYSIGLAYAPDWGEHTLSFRPNETVVVPEDAVVHVILGMWMQGWGMEVSETIQVRERDAVCLTNFSRSVHLVG